MEQKTLPWDLHRLFTGPRIFQTDFTASDGVHSLFYEGLPYRGRETKVFAHYALPERSKEKQVPGIVLVHGGGGTAYSEWVRMWADKGYAAIAMDLEGHVPSKMDGMAEWTSHYWPGPKREGIYADCGEPIEDQWMFHAAANVMLAHSLLRGMQQVDSQRIGITGISWGGIVTSLVAGIDKRFAFGIPVYGCGYLFEAQNQWGKRFADMEETCAESVKRFTEPSAYLSEVEMPMLWVNWLYDPHFAINIFCKSYVSSENGIEQSGLCMYPRLGHSHPNGWKPAEIVAFADSIVREGEPLLRLARPTEQNGKACVEYKGGEAVKAELYYTNNCDNWLQCEWLTVECEVDRTNGCVLAHIPQDTKAYFMNVYDYRDFTASTTVVVRE